MFKIAVIVPTMNRAELLAETIRSVQLQSSADWELIVVDDGSTDQTAVMMKAVVLADNRIQYFPREGAISGANVCRNQGAREAQAEWIMFLDSDDLLAPTCIENRIRWLERNQDLDFIVCHADAFLREPGDLNRPASSYKLGGDLDRFLYFDLPWLVTGPTWRKNAFQRLGGFNETIPSWQDVELHLRAILQGLIYLTLPIVDYHVRWQNDPAKTSLQQRRSEHHLLVGEKTIDSFEKMLYETKQENWSRLRAIVSLKLLIAELWANQNRWADAKRVWNTVKKSPVNSMYLFYGGKVLLLLKRIRLADKSFMARCIHYWKGLVRLRQEPRLVP